MRLFTNKPILLSETAVGPGPRQFAKISNLFEGMRRYKTLGLVWFDDRPGGQHLPPGLAHRGQPVGRDGLPPRHLHADAGAALAVARPARRAERRGCAGDFPPAGSRAHRPWHNFPVLDGRAGAETQQFRIWVAAPGPVIRELLRYRGLALLAIALACLAGLIIIRVRRRRKERRDPARGALGAEAARGRHAVGGPAGFGELPAAQPDLTHLAVARRGVPDPAMGRPSRGTRRPADKATDEPGLTGFSPDGPIADHAPVEEAPAENGAPAGGAPPGTLQALGLELGENGIRQAPAGPPREPAEKPPGERPSPEDRDDPPPQRSAHPGEATDVPPPEPGDGTGR